MGLWWHFWKLEATLMRAVRLNQTVNLQSGKPKQWAERHLVELRGKYTVVCGVLNTSMISDIITHYDFIWFSFLKKAALKIYEIFHDPPVIP